jgi:hypothetical protein
VAGFCDDDTVWTDKYHVMLEGMLSDRPMPLICLGRFRLALSLQRLTRVQRSKRRCSVTVTAGSSRYTRFTENAEAAWQEFFAEPPLYFDLRKYKASPKFADFQLKKDRGTALYIADQPGIWERLQELDALPDPALKA